MESGSLHYRSFFGWCSIHCKLWNISTFFYHTPTSFPVQPPADKMHEYLTVKGFILNILPLHMWPNEVIAMKDASVAASDNKP